MYARPITHVQEGVNPHGRLDADREFARTGKRPLVVEGVASREVDVLLKAGKRHVVISVEILLEIVLIVAVLGAGSYSFAIRITKPCLGGELVEELQQVDGLAADDDALVRIGHTLSLGIESTRQELAAFRSDKLVTGFWYYTRGGVGL